MPDINWLAGYRKRGLESGKSEWGNGDLTALQMIFSKVVSEAGESEKIARFFRTGAAMILLIDNYDLLPGTSTSTFVNWGGMCWLTQRCVDVGGYRRP